MVAELSYENEEHNAFLKSFWVYRNVEKALKRLGKQSGKQVRSNANATPSGGQREAGLYRHSPNVISIGLKAHERLYDGVRSSIIYLEPQEDDCPVNDDITRLANLLSRAGISMPTIFLGRRGRQAAAFLSGLGGRYWNVPPIDLSDLPSNGSPVPRLTIVNHLTDPSFARSIAHCFLDRTDFFVDCVGVAGQPHNRVRYLKDNEVGDGQADAHIHIGKHSSRVDRLRICDSWQSKVPVLYFAHADGSSLTESSIEVSNEHDALICESFSEANTLLALLLDTPALRRILTSNGRSSARSDAGAWDTIALELAA